MSVDDVLLRSQKNAVFQLIREAELDPSDFAWEVLTGRPRLVHTASGFWYFFGTPNCQFSPGIERKIENGTTGIFKDHFPWIGAWLKNLKRETAEPDLWLLAGQEAELLKAASSADSDNARFSVEERERIVAGFAEVETYISAAYHLEAEQLASIKGRLEYLIAASERMGRKDWCNVVLGTMAGLVASAVAPPEVVRSMVGMIGALLRSLFQSIPLLQ